MAIGRNDASFNELSTGSKNAKEFQRQLDNLTGSAAQLLQNFSKLPEALGHNVDLLSQIAKSINYAKGGVGETVGIYSELATSLGMTSDEYTKQLQSQKDELELAQKFLGFQKQKLQAMGEDTSLIDEQLEKNRDAYILAQRQLEVQEKANAAVDNQTTRYKRYLAERKKGTEQAKKDLEIAKERAKAEMAQTGEISEETQASLNQAQIRVDRRESQDNAIEKLGNSFQAGFDKLAASIDGAFGRVESAFISYQGTINARLNGTQKTFSSMNKMLQANLSMSMFVSQQKVLDNINKAVEAGIAYNIEERAFLQTVSENVAATFDAFDSNLLRVIRLQQSDSTAARLGLERELTTLFNQYFSDSSYMSQMYDSVMANLVEATSTMARNQSVEFEATAQKWLGALYSIGLSESAVSNIASGINLLGSGNVDALAGNTQLQNLLAMSANRAGLDYGNLLIGGFNGGRELNDLLYSMVDYLAEIADSTAENNVVRSAYGNVFNLTMSDWRAIANMGDTLSNIYSTNIGYSQTTNSAQQGIYQMANLGGHGIGLPAMLNNLMDNIMFGSMSTVVSNPITYSMYKMTDMLESLTGGIAIPAISIFGNAVDLETTFERLMKTGIFGLGMTINGISSVLRALTGQGGAGWDISSWGGEEVNTRGVSETLSTTTGVSASAQIGNASSEDAEETLLSNATADAKRQDKTKSGKQRKEADKSFDDLYNALFAPEAEAVLSTAATSIANVENEIITLNSDIHKAMSENAFNVNVQSFGNINMQNGIPIYFSGGTGTGTKQMESFIKTFIAALGFDSSDQPDLNAYTLQDLINFFMDTVGAEEGAGMNVNLAGNEVSATTFLSGQTGFERY